MSSSNITSNSTFTSISCSSNFSYSQTQNLKFNSDVNLIERTEQVIKKTEMSINGGEEKSLHSIRVELLLVHSLVDKDLSLDTDYAIKTKKNIEQQVIKCERALLEKKSYGITFCASIFEQNFSSVFEQGDGIKNLFETVVEKDLGEVAFDLLLRHVNSRVINENKIMKSAILQFAFSPAHYSSILLQPEKIPADVFANANSLIDLKIANITDLINNFSSNSPEEYEQWLKSRSSQSTTISGSYNESVKGFQDWRQAELGIRKLASIHGSQKKPFNSKSMNLFHQTLTTHSEDVKYKGETRNIIMEKDYERSVVNGGTWESLFCPPQMLEKNLQECFNWYNDALEKCHHNEQNPVIVAAQIYQRILSLHPFENGNGRVARCLMDYTLMRFDLPPCVLKNVRNDGVLPLKPAQDHSFLVNRVAEGVKESHKLLSKSL